MRVNGLTTRSEWTSWQPTEPHTANYTNYRANLEKEIVAVVLRVRKIDRSPRLLIACRGSRHSLFFSLTTAQHSLHGLYITITPQCAILKFDSTTFINRNCWVSKGITCMSHYKFAPPTISPTSRAHGQTPMASCWRNQLSRRSVQGVHGECWIERQHP